MFDPKYMDYALDLAARGGRSVMPNPMVGAVIVLNDHIIGEGYHQQYGGHHAEVFAIDSVQDRSLLKDATIYVTLEPCAHFGKTPPCADLLINSGIRSVIVGCKDPNPKVAGRGIQKLREAGISVHEGVRETECVLLNKRFIISHRQKRPYVILKWAETADKFIARVDGSSKWISSAFSRKITHRWRAQEMSILVGTNTARLDNPKLTVRHIEGANPLRIVIDRELSLAHDLALFNQEVETWVFNNTRKDQSGLISWRQLSNTMSIPAQILEQLHQAQKLSLIVEGGAHTLQAFIDDDLWDEARVFNSPKLFGSGLAAPLLGQPCITSMVSGKDRIEIFEHPQLFRRLGIEQLSASVASR